MPNGDKLAYWQADHQPAQLECAREEDARVRKEAVMSVAKVSEISTTSPKSFEDAIQQGLGRASKTLRNIKSAWVKEQLVRCDTDGRVTEYQVNLMVTFVLDD
jgi:dodecin